MCPFRNSPTSPFVCSRNSQSDENVVVRAHEQRRCYLMAHNAPFILGYLILVGRVGVLLSGARSENEETVVPPRQKPAEEREQHRVSCLMQPRRPTVCLTGDIL